MVNAKKIIAYIELVVYIPTLLACAYVVFKHGFRRQLGWIYLAVFCGIRVAGAGFEIEAVAHPTNSTDVEWATILQSVGLSPLLLATMGLLKRICDQTTDSVASGPLPGPRILFKNVTATSKRSRVLQFMLLPCTIALILCIAGGTDQASSNVADQNSGKKDTKAGIIMFLIIYLLTVFIFFITFGKISKVIKRERKILYAILFALPFIALRLLFSLLSTFSNNRHFSYIYGTWEIQFCMATIEEFVVVLMYMLVGLFVGKVDTPDANIEMTSTPEVYPQQQAQTYYAPPPPPPPQQQQGAYFTAPAPYVQDISSGRHSGRVHKSRRSDRY